MDKKKLVFFFLLVISFILVGCSIENDNSVSPPTVEEIITKNPDADIFMFRGVIYEANIDWIDELTLIKGEKIGEITEQAVDDHYKYKDGMANKLSVGAIIYEVEESSARENNTYGNGVVIVDDHGEQKYYMANMEG
ncbi:hypothetical protein [Alkalicoccobacillus plakortidis]|uniref:Uncharacterized protein n=1 Tax=Alkalicoccobacillus plakortidis TaxID=444060 RepID=A0ABT0XQ44_9BACI|nr:hypothetical protein [Alkalicoccobacillus plakortidis]MCM2678031.1 hypothetical protein [Alkalicoccobacillus plakortidis]